MSGTIHYFDECVVCNEPNPSHLFKPCNHKCICTTCVNSYSNNWSLQTCPLCREKYCSIERDDSKPKNVMDEEEQLGIALRLSLQEAEEEEARRKEEESFIQQQILAIDLETRQKSEVLEHKRILSSIVDLVKREAAKIESGLHLSSLDMTRGAQFARDETELRLIQNVENAFCRIKESIKLRRSVQLDEWNESIGFDNYNSNSLVSSSISGTTFGTTVKFRPISGTDTMVVNGVTRVISTRHFYITSMKEYESKSLEELRLEDYSIPRRVTRPVVTRSTKTLEFGSTHQLPDTGLFSKSATGFGLPSASTFSFAPTSSFNAVNFQTKPFGPTSQPSSFLFENSSQTSTKSFSNTATPASRLRKNSNFNRANQSTRQFNQKKASSGVSSIIPTFCFSPPTDSKNLGADFKSVPVNSTLQSGSTGFGITQNSNSTGFSSQFKFPTFPTCVAIPATSTALISDNHKTSVISTSSVERDSNVDEAKSVSVHDFAPIIPLPDEKPITTGEEDEEGLFCARAELFRFVDNEWKERGIGNVKLLKNKEGKIRLLMRSEQLHKICANHMLQKDMQLTVMPDNEKAYTWVANNYADEKLRLERLAIRFKTVEEATTFKEHFDRAKNSLSDEATKTIDVNIMNSEDGALNEPPKTDSTQNKSIAEAGGFSFTSSTIIPKALAQDSTTKVHDQPTSKTSLFDFSFGKFRDSENEKLTNPAISFQTLASNVTTPTSLVSANADSTLGRPDVPTLTNSAEANAVSRVDKPLSELFKSAPGSWICKSCYIRNDQSNEYCVACETPSNPLLTHKLKPSGSLSHLLKDTSSFNFSGPQNQTPGFQFNAQSSTPEKFTFPTSNNCGANGSSFSSGVQSSCTSSMSGEEGSFTFAPSGKGFNFQLEKKSQFSKSPKCLESSGDDAVGEPEDPYFAPLIPLPEKIEAKTGEEDEDVLYSHRAKLYRYDIFTREWKERGVGDIKLLRHVETKKLRFVMRRDQVLKLCLNHAISSSVEIIPKDDKTWMWSAGDFSEGEINYMQFACRFPTPEVAKQFKKVVDDARKSQSNSVTPSFESTAVNQTRQMVHKQSSPDLEVVHEVRVTPEEKAAAQKLMLPHNFYAYKYKADCSGCIGCRDSDEIISKTPYHTMDQSRR